MRRGKLDSPFPPWSTVVLELALLPILFFLPGYFLTNLIFPRDGSIGGDLDLLYRLFLGVLLSVALAIVYGWLLVVVGTATEQVLFLPETLWPGLLVLTVLFFAAGLYRGAYPKIRRLLDLPTLPPERGEIPDTRAFDRLKELTEELEGLRKMVREEPGADRESGRRRERELEAEIRRLEEEARRMA